MNVQGPFTFREMFEDVCKKYSEEEQNLNNFERELIDLHDQIRGENRRLDSTENYPALNSVEALHATFITSLQKLEEILPRFFELQTVLTDVITKFDKTQTVNITTLRFLSTDIAQTTEQLIFDLNIKITHLQMLREKVSSIYKRAKNSELPNLRNHSLKHFEQHIGRIRVGEKGPSSLGCAIDRFRRYLPL